ncbi:MAG: SUMF1/EgtB/PvdO family nonheme iron enzyme [Bacteroidia bacterium]|nr:SUMF1/EgtB/PvdO family nonheme iron enzyme [Bacteroidia bacterium]
MIHKLITFLCLAWLASPLLANNIQVSNLTLSSSDATQDFAMISLTLSWENSWLDVENHDAAWVFLKYRPTGSNGAWSHATLHYVDGTNDGHVIPLAGTVNTSSDGKGVFIYRSGTGSGNFSLANVELRWDYGTDGLADNATVEIAAHAIEMVYVPGGSFWLGDGSTSAEYGQFEDGISGNALQITSEGALTLGGGGSGSVGNRNTNGMANDGLFSLPGVSTDDFNDLTTQTLPATFPKGFQAFYCMKYEITQGQYVEFLNEIDSAQFLNRYDPLNYSTSHGGFGTTRYNITGTWPNMTTITPCLPSTYVEWYDAVAYADWAGLRPMTEFEFEKAARGPSLPVPDEYAWGNTNIATSSYFTITNQNGLNEAIGVNYSTTAGNAWYSTTIGFNAPVRVGIFAAHPANTGRVTSGASYWGLFELSGHCWERAVSVGRPEGRGFTGSHGDGNLNALGNADNPDWPGFTTGIGVDHAVGGGYRGGAFNFPNPTQPNLQVSSRIVATAFYNTRYFDDAVRFVRTAP